MTSQKKCPTNSPTCNCNQQVKQMEMVIEKKGQSSKRTFRAMGSTFLSVLIAFFPKCPLCWAAYLSMFGSFGLSNIPYMGWLYPVLLGFLGLHLYFIYKKVKVKGYWPFILSVLGAFVLLSSRFFQTDNKQVLITGMMLILIGSLWNNFSFHQFKLSTQ